MTTAGRLDRLATLPAWLAAAADPDQVGAAVGRHLPELAGGAVLGCKVERLRLRADGWFARYRLTVDRGDGPVSVRLAGTLRPPGSAGDPANLPELGLDLHPEPAEAGLPELPMLTDPERARPYLEGLLRTGSPRLADLRLAGCRPEVLRHKAGNRCTIRYGLDHGPDGAGRGWPDMVIAKTYAKDVAGGTWRGMRALWASGLSSGEVVGLAEPLAYDPERRVLVQGPVAGDRNLKQFARSALADGSPAALAGLRRTLERTAAGLATVHRSGVREGAAVGWDDELAKLRAALPGLALAGQDVAEAADDLIRALTAAAAASPPDAAGPAHRAFRPGQVLLDGDRVGFIDFDGFCQAEPAMDVGAFLAAMANIGIDTPGPGGAGVPEDLAARFLAAYGELAPVGPARVAVWEALELVTSVLNGWIKVQQSRLPNRLAALETSGTLTSLTAGR
jgi:hypothetical protein